MRYELTDEEWAGLPSSPAKRAVQGTTTGDRHIPNGILWVTRLKKNAWANTPPRFNRAMAPCP